MNILVAGGCGFIGSNLVKRLLIDGHKVWIFDDLSKGSLEKLDEFVNHENLKFYKLDVTSKEIFEVPAKFNVVVDLVAYKIPRYSSAINTLIVNTRGAENLMRLAVRDGAKLIMASTSDIYGKSQDFPYREDGDLVFGPSTSRRWAYAVSKLFNEHLAFAFHDEFGLTFVILRFFGAYGPHMYLDWWGGPIGVFLKNIYEDRPVTIHGDGTQRRSFVYIDDLVEGIVRAIYSNKANDMIINIGNHEEISILDLAKLIHRLSYPEKELKIEFVPYTSFTANYEDPKRRVGDCSRMKEILGFEAKYSLEEGLIKFIGWFKGRVEKGLRL